MGQTKKEKFMFTILMCAGMVIFMSMYNILLLEGFSSHFFMHLIAGLIPGFFVALLLDVFVAGPAARFLLNKITTEQTKPIQKILCMSCFMIFFMVLFMSLYGVVVNVGITPSFPQLYADTLWKNALFALPLQLLVVGPIVRAIFLKLYAGKSALA